MEARNALAAQQQHRAPAAATARASGLRCDRVEQFGNAGRPGGADIARAQDILGRDVADHRAARFLADDNNLLAVVLGRGLIDRGRRRRLGERGQRHGPDEQQGDERGVADHGGRNSWGSGMGPQGWPDNAEAAMTIRDRSTKGPLRHDQQMFSRRVTRMCAALRLLAGAAASARTTAALYRG